MLRKVGLYILSLWLLFLFITVLTIDIPIYFGVDTEFIGIFPLLSQNIVAFTSIVLLFVGIGVFRYFRFILKGSTHIPFEITKVESINYEHLTFLATYIVPLICFDLESTRYLIILVLLLVSMGMIYIKTDLFYANPSLALLGFHIYKVDGNFKVNRQKQGIILLSRSRLTQNQKVKYIKLDDRIFYVKPIL